MKHYEYMYLVNRAHGVRDLELEAIKDGEEFFPSTTFTELADGGEVHFRITDYDSDVLAILLVRNHPTPDDVAGKMYKSLYTRVGTVEGGATLYFSTEIPERFQMKESDATVPDPTDDVRADEEDS